MWALVLLFIIMIPNLTWFAVPAPHDILREESVTVVVDTIASLVYVYFQIKKKPRFIFALDRKNSLEVSAFRRI